MNSHFAKNCALPQNKTQLHLMNIPQNLLYTPDHEWVRTDGEHLYIGITDFAQDQLGEIVYVDVDCLGKQLAEHDVFGTIETVKAVSELFMPIAGTVVAVNDILADQPDTINQSPYEEAWMIRVLPDNPADINKLLSAERYTALINE